MYEQKFYFKYPLNYKLILDLLNKKNKSKLNIFIDFNSICKGFYKAETILYEISEYAEHNKVSGKLISELKDFLNNLYNTFKSYDPFFIIFYDDGKCTQNRSIMNTYKSGRSINNIDIDNEKSIELFRKIRKYYYLKIQEEFNKPDLCSVQYLPDWETDLVPYYCLKYNIFDSYESDVLNIVLSIDKDLLQICQIDNVLQCVTNFKANKTKGKYEIHFDMYDKNNAVKYLYPEYNGTLTARYIPLILSIAGDKSDDIMGITGFGYTKAIKLIEKNNMPYNIDLIKNNINIMPEIIQKNINIIIRNYKLISFEEQLKRLPKNFLV